MHDPLRSKAKLLVSVTLAFLFGLGMASGLGWTAPTHAMPVILEAPQVSEAAVKPAMDLSEAFVNVSDAVTPAVVRIQVERSRSVASMEGIPEPFRQFFDAPEGGEQMRPSISGGSGFIVSEDGYILTNDHVVSGAEAIMVWTRDRRSYPAEIVGTDPTTDVAVIKIEGEGLPVLALGDDDDVRVGEWILAVGNPGFGGATQLDYSVTAGIISAKGRPLQLISQELRRNPDFQGNPEASGFAIENFIQTDAVINPGNSGGPMVNLRGQVVGINSAIASRTGFYQGYGFAIPISLARRVMEDLIEYGAVRRPWMGVSMQNIDAVDAEGLGLPEVRGAVVQAVTEGSPAEKAGIEKFDILWEINGQPVATSNEIQSRVAQFRPGDRIDVTVYRDGRPLKLEIRLGEAPIAPTGNEPTRIATESRSEEKLGIEVTPLTEELARRYEYDEAGGVVITGVRMGGAASRRGVVEGSKILEVDGRPIEDQGDLREALSEAEAGEVVSLVLGFPDGSSRIVNVRVPGN